MYIRYPDKILVVGHGVLFAVAKEFVSTDTIGVGKYAYCLNCYGPGSGSGAIVHEGFPDKEAAMLELDSAWEEIGDLGEKCLDMRVKVREEEYENE